MKKQHLWQKQKDNRKMFWNLVGLLDQKEKKEFYLCMMFSVFSPIVDWTSIYMLILTLGRLSGSGISRGMAVQSTFLGVIFLVKGAYDLLKKKTSNNFLKNIAQAWSVKIYELYSKEELLEHNQWSVMQQVTGARTDTEVCADIMVTFINRT